jgi:hypothetical protein
MVLFNSVVVPQKIVQKGVVSRVKIGRKYGAKAIKGIKFFTAVVYSNSMLPLSLS